jgi:hypothetical protein
MTASLVANNEVRDNGLDEQYVLRIELERRLSISTIQEELELLLLKTHRLNEHSKVHQKGDCMLNGAQDDTVQQLVLGSQGIQGWGLAGLDVRWSPSEEIQIKNCLG